MSKCVQLKKNEFATCKYILGCVAFECKGLNKQFGTSRHNRNVRSLYVINTQEFVALNSFR